MRRAREFRRGQQYVAEIDVDNRRAQAFELSDHLNQRLEHQSMDEPVNGGITQPRTCTSPSPEVIYREGSWTSQFTVNLIE